MTTTNPAGGPTIHDEAPVVGYHDLDTDDVVQAMGERDTALAAQQPSSIPEGWEHDNFFVPNLPEEPFSLVDYDTGEELGPFRKEEFVTDPTTNITSAHDPEGKPFILRVIAQGPGTLDNVLDNGIVNRYIVSKLKDGELEEPELPGPAPTHMEDEDF